MALSTTFTALTSGVRDDSAVDSDVYYLDGNSTDGRLNLSSGTKWIAPRYLTVVHDGNPNHSFMDGHIEADFFRYIAKPNNGRLDFQGRTGWVTANKIEYIFNGFGASGSVFTHLEPTGNKFGEVSFIFDSTVGGGCIVQFGNREYPNVTFTVKETNTATINLFPARNHSNYTAFTGFRTEGLSSLVLLAGSQSTSHGRIYDPVYDGQPDNYLDITQNTNITAKLSKEYFSLDLTAIFATDLSVLVSDSSGINQYNLICSTDNTTARDWASRDLAYYAGRNVLLVHQRDIKTTSSTRKQIAYKLRRPGYLEINQPPFAMNAPVVLKEHAIDEVFGNTTFDPAETTAQSVYDELSRFLAANILIDVDYSIDGGALVLDRSVVFDGSATENITASADTITIHSDLHSGAVRATAGTVTAINGASIAGGIIDANGDSYLSFAGIDAWQVYSSEADRNISANAVASGTGADLFRFNFSAGVTYYMWVTAGDTLPKTVTPESSGETVVSLQTAALLAQIGSDVKLARDHARAADVQTKPI